MTELAIRDNGAVAHRDDDYADMPLNAQTSALVLWAYEANQAHQIAIKLAATSFVPASLRGKAGDVTAAILAGQELGLKPMASLRSMDVIQGTPALRAHAMRGLVQSHGHTIQLVESTETRCRMRGRRRGEEEWQTVTWTIERATKLGLTNKDQWRKQPQTMLMARATGEICRLVASDALYAMPYAAEELTDDLAPVSMTAERTAAEPKKRTARRAALPPPEPPAEPDLDEPTPTVVGPTITDKQQRMMHALFRDKGFDPKDRDRRLRFVSDVLGYPVTSSAELTVGEAGDVIDALQGMPDVAEPEPDVNDNPWGEVATLGGES